MKNHKTKQKSFNIDYKPMELGHNIGEKEILRTCKRISSGRVCQWCVSRIILEGGYYSTTENLLLGMFHLSANSVKPKLTKGEIEAINLAHRIAVAKAEAQQRSNQYQ